MALNQSGRITRGLHCCSLLSLCPLVLVPVNQSPSEMSKKTRDTSPKSSREGSVSHSMWHFDSDEGIIGRRFSFLPKRLPLPLDKNAS